VSSIHEFSLAHASTIAPGDDPADRLRGAIERAAHVLPAQGPIAVFVFLNRLHAFEDRDFEEAVSIGAKAFNCHPYWTQEQYHRELERGRILPEDLAAELIDDLGDHADALLGFLGTRYQLRLAMLEQPLRLAPTRELEWLITESDALRQFRDEVSPAIRAKLLNRTRQWILRDWSAGHVEGQPARVRETVEPLVKLFGGSRAQQWSDSTWVSFVLNLLWQACLQGVRDAAPPMPASPMPNRHRDLLLEASGEDSDALVNPMLIRFCAAFCDQGLAHWPLPNRDAGFFRAFSDLYGQAGARSPEPWLRGLQEELEAHATANLGPLESIQRSLDDLGVAEHEQESYLAHTLLALRGWAGMICQMETRGDRVPHPAPPGSVVGFLAVRLVLERLALTHIARASLGWHGSLRDLRGFLAARIPLQPPLTTEQRAFQLFQLAQLRGWRPEVLCRLPTDQWTTLIREVEAFSTVERRRIFHRAYERRYRTLALDAIAAHTRAGKCHKEDNVAEKPRPPFQIITCIDDREESFRRHLEEIEPASETFGAAGFFAVAMYFRGAADAHDTPLCPIDVTPQHYVREHVALTFEDSERVRKQTRHAIGTMTHRLHVGSRTFIGGALAAVLGSLASLPLVMRILFPRTTAHMRTWFGRLVEPPPVTYLELERSENTPGTGAGHVGYTMAEMTAIVDRLLHDIGLTDRFARLVLLLGHGSSSQNNPHESAYNCGACAGSRGGPNARAFAQMANDPRVREQLAHRGVVIPDSTRFIGGYHNTCDDSVLVYDLERLPSTHTNDFIRLRAVVNEARRRNAQERCRRFYSANLNLSSDAALRHVEARAEDLSQVRPEYKHANALCLVGRRELSRGLFLDRRAFLQSYDPAQDDERFSILTRVLQAVVPVCAGINLEYYFSSVDPVGWGSGNKLSHNIASLVGVMDGAASDLRPGLTRQMIEIHEPMRLLFVIETTASAIRQIMDRNPRIAALIRGSWVQVAIIDPATGAIAIYRQGQFERFSPAGADLPHAATSREWYRGRREDVGFARIEPVRTSHAGPPA
jgi:uncharacterized protein YbcC (UPF0753/DUF2309 family)